jgi:O-antigen/teichoic acid export membrane protein
VLSFAQPLAFLIVRSVLFQRLGSTGAGLFQAAFATSSIASLVLMQAIRVYLEPAVNTATINDTRIAATNDFQRTFAVIILMGSLPLVLFPRNIVAILFSSAFTPVSSLLFVFVLSDFLLLCTQVYGTVVVAVDDFTPYLIANIAGYVGLCAGVWLTIDRFGITGVAWSFVASRALVFLLVQGLLLWRHRLTMTLRAAAVVLYAMGALSVAAAVFGSTPVADVQAFLIRMLIFVAVAAGTLAFLTQAERAWLGTACRRLVEAR